MSFLRQLEPTQNRQGLTFNGFAVKLAVAERLYVGKVEPVSYTHLDVYKRQQLFCLSFSNYIKFK